MKLNEMKQKIETIDNKMEEKIDNKITKKMETIDNAMEGRIYNKIAIKLDNNENAKVNELEKKIDNNEKEIKDLKVLLNIINEIMNQKDIYYKRHFNYVNRNLRMLLNSYKMLYMRKSANISLKEIYKKYNQYLGRAKIGKYNIIAFFKKNYLIDGYNVHQLNLLIDFLRFIWDKCSDVIHLNDKNFPFVKEIFYEYSGEYSGKKLIIIK